MSLCTTTAFGRGILLYLCALIVSDVTADGPTFNPQTGAEAQPGTERDLLTSSWLKADKAFTEINDQLANYNARNADVDGVRCNLAVSFGDLTGRNIQQLQTKFKIMIAGTLRTLKKNPELTRTWDSLMAAMKNNPLIQEVTSGRIYRQDGYVISQLNLTEVNTADEDDAVDDESHMLDATIVPGTETVEDEFKRWMAHVIREVKVDTAREMPLEVNSLAQVIREIAAINGSRKDGSGVREDVTVLDIGYLRFPDPTYSFMKIYRMKLMIWQDSYQHRVSQVKVETRYKNGLTVEFNSAKFKPRESVISRLRPHIVEKACSEVDALFTESRGQSTPTY